MKPNSFYPKKQRHKNYETYDDEYSDTSRYEKFSTRKTHFTKYVKIFLPHITKNYSRYERYETKLEIPATFAFKHRLVSFTSLSGIK